MTTKITLHPGLPLAPLDDATDELIDHFVRQAERAASVVHRCASEQEIANLVTRLAVDGRVSVSKACVERYPSLAALLDKATDVIRPSSAVDAAEAAVGVSAGEALIVETGSILVSEPDLPDRLVSMLSPILVQVVSVDSILPRMEDVGAFLEKRHEGGARGYHALVTGPSRSADIERSLTIGVQGPSEVHIALLFATESPNE